VPTVSFFSVTPGQHGEQKTQRLPTACFGDGQDVTSKGGDGPGRRLYRACRGEALLAQDTHKWWWKGCVSQDGDGLGHVFLVDDDVMGGKVGDVSKGGAWSYGRRGLHCCNTIIAAALRSAVFGSLN
jgi:hypothetical protein